MASSGRWQSCLRTGKAVVGRHLGAAWPADCGGNRAAERMFGEALAPIQRPGERLVLLITSGRAALAAAAAAEQAGREQNAENCRYNALHP